MSPLTTRGALLIAAALFVVVTVIRFSLESTADGYALLYVLPIAVSALALGLPGGLGAALLAIALVIAWGQIDDVGLSLAGYLTRALTFFVLGGLVGYETQQRRRYQADRERLLARVEAMARTDELTGLANRRAWDEELRREMARAGRSGGALAVAMLDLDRFKQYNDLHGHPAGDQLLVQAASEWRVRLRVVDMLARYGGEEFAVLLPGCPPAEAAAIVERVRCATPMQQTVSAGIAHWDGGETAEALIERVDRALYAAKRAGRDRCVVAGRA